MKIIRFGALCAVTACVAGVALTACAKDEKKNETPQAVEFAIGGNYLAANGFSEGLALVKDGTGLAYIDTDGKLVFRTQATEAGKFSEGKAWYKLADGKGGYMTKTGETLGDEISSFGAAVQDDYKNGLAAVTSTQAYGVDAFVLDETGKPSALFDRFVNTGEYGGFYGGYAWYLPQNGNLYGYLKTDGSVLVSPKYTAAGDFSCGRARVEEQSGVSYIDETGATVFTLPAGATAGDFSDDALKIETADGVYFVGLDGEKLFEQAYTAATDFSEDKAAVTTADGIKVVDKTGKTLFSAPAGATALGEYHGGVATYCAGNKWGYLDDTGKILVEAKLDYADDSSEGFAACRYNGKWGYLKLGKATTDGEQEKEPQTAKYKIYFDLQLSTATLPEGLTLGYDETKKLYYAEVEAGAQYTPFTPVCEGYTFKEWQYVSDSTKTFTGGKYDRAGDTYLLAVWTGGEIIETPVK